MSKLVTVQFRTDDSTDAPALVAALAYRANNWPVQIAPPVTGTAYDISYVSEETVADEVATVEPATEDAKA